MDKAEKTFSIAAGVIAACIFVAGVLVVWSTFFRKDPVPYIEIFKNAEITCYSASTKQGIYCPPVAVNKTQYAKRH